MMHSQTQIKFTNT